MGLRHDQILHGPVITGGFRFTGLSPFRVVMPIHEANQGIVDFVEQPPYPIEPKRLEAFHRWSSDARRFAVEPRLQRALDAASDLLVHRPILLEVDAATNPVVIGFVPNAPIPILYVCATPLLRAAPDD